MKACGCYSLLPQAFIVGDPMKHKLSSCLSVVVAVLCFFVATCKAQERDSPTTIVETGYYIIARKVVVAVVAANPFEDQFASHPGIRITLRASDGSIITTREKSSAGIPPKSKIAFCADVYFDERPATVDIRPTSAGYERTVYRASDFRPFELLNLRMREGESRVQVTGEIKNPYPAQTGAWITFLFRNAKGKIVSGASKWVSEVLAGDPTPFEFSIPKEDVSPEATSIEKIVFDHNNELSSWQKLLRR